MPAPSLVDSWNGLVRSGPRRTAVIDAATGKSWSRVELDDSARAWAAMAPSDLHGAWVGFAAPNGPEWLALLIGLLRSGATAVPLDPSDPPEVRCGSAAAAGADMVWEGGRFILLGRGLRRRRPPACLVKLTSGSTGTPRAFPFTHAEMIADGRQICAGMDIRPGDLNAGLVPFGHSYGLGNLVVPLLEQGTRVLTGLFALPQALGRDFARWRPTVFPSVPPILRGLAESDVPRSRLASLRIVLSAGAPLSPELARSFHQRFGRWVHVFYGSSETGGISYDRTGKSGLSAGKVGRPLPGVRLSFGTRGRLWVESAAVFKKRHSPPDLARLETEGELILLGRSGRQLKIAGRRLDPREVEGALCSLPGVTDAWVGSDPRRPESVAAVAAGVRDAGPLRQALRSRLAPWKIPRRIVAVADLPRNARGKLDSVRLAAILQAP